MAAAGNEAHQLATHRLGDRLIVHGEGVMCVGLGRETCQAEPRERDQPTEVSSALRHHVLLCSWSWPSINRRYRGEPRAAGDDTGLSGFHAYSRRSHMTRRCIDAVIVSATLMLSVATQQQAPVAQTPKNAFIVLVVATTHHPQHSCI